MFTTADNLQRAHELHGDSASLGGIENRRTFMQRVSALFWTEKFTKSDSKGVFAASCYGCCSYQQDRAGYFFLNLDLKDQPNNVIEQILYDTFMNLGEETKECESGSTLVACLQVGNRIFVANVGDSRAFLVEEVKENDSLYRTVTPLSWEHKPSVPSESERIKEAGGTIEDVMGVKRLGGNLMVSRAFGDKSVQNLTKGLIYEPDISVKVLENNTKAYVILCSDGVTDAMETSDIEDFIKREKSFVITAKQLVNEAYFRRLEYLKHNSDGRCDNIGAVVTDASELMKKNSYPVLSFVADGHGGDEVSEYIKRNLARVLFESIREKLGEVLKVSEEPIDQRSKNQDIEVNFAPRLGLY